MTIDGKQLKAASVASAALALPALVSAFRLTSNFSPGSTGSLVDVTGASLTVPKAGSYLMEFYFSKNSPNGTLFSWAVNVTGGTITNFLVTGYGPLGQTSYEGNSTTTNGGAFVSGTVTTTAQIPHTFWGSFDCTASGTAQLQVNSGSTSLTVLIGSWGRLTRIA